MENFQADIESQEGLVPVNYEQYGDFVVKWGFDSEKPMAWLRALRNKKLKETDWMSAQDRPTLTQEWRDYRQALRDLPENFPNPTYDAINGLGNVTWPTEPS